METHKKTMFETTNQLQFLKPRLLVSFLLHLNHNRAAAVDKAAATIIM